MKRSTLLLILLTALTAFPASAQVNDTYVIPAAINSPGAFGTRWMTQFNIFNPSLEHDLTVTVIYLPSGGGNILEEAIIVPANEARYSDNVLLELFNITGSGSLLVATFQDENPTVPDDVISRAFLVTSNTYNNDPSGTYGQTIAGVWAGLQDYDTDGISAIAHGVRNVRRLGWRTNVGAVNLGRSSVTLYVTAFNARGDKVLNNAPFLIPPFAHIQDGLPVEVDRGTLEFVVDGDRFENDPADRAVVFAYAATVDELSGDPTYHSPTLLASPSIIYSKKAMIEPTAIGRKLDREIAAKVREQARPRGQIKSLHSR